jgi:hypothetical protein
MSTELRKLGTIATLLPNLKRAVGKHSDGYTIIFMPDTNLATSAGADVTGVAKFYIYASTSSTRTTFNQLVAYTPVQAGSSSTKKFVGSMALNSDNDVFVAYQGTDNSLRLVTWNWNGTSYDAGVSQTVVAANAVTNRYRAIDIDVANSSTGNPAIIAYEASASTGQGAYARVYVRLNDGTTWRKAYETQLQTTGFIKDTSEDVSISYGYDGIVSNVGKLAIYFTRTNTTTDSGDTLRELTFNVSTGTDLSATVVGTWSSTLNKNVASSGRRGWLFKHINEPVSATWVFGGVVGTTTPFYMGCKLHHNSFTFTINKTTNNPSEITNRKFPILRDTNRAVHACVTAVYGDQRLEFISVGIGGTVYAYSVRATVMRWSESSANDTTEYIDTVTRFADNNYSIANGPLAVYGGCNRVNDYSYQYTSVAIYGTSGTAVSTTPGVYDRTARVIIEDTLPAPSIIQPSLDTVSKNLPAYQVQVTADKLYPMVKGRLQINVASDPLFLTNSFFMIEPESELRGYESSNGVTFSTKYITYQSVLGEELFTGTWYWRCRIWDDMGGSSAWVSSQFNVSHPPAALPRFPSEGSTVDYSAGDFVFYWDFSDPEPTDSQTAYQVIVTRLDTGATVVDTTKTLSSAPHATISIPPSLISYPLSYTVKLWDSDDNPGTPSAPVNFTLADPPVVVITTPLAGDVVTTGLPTIGWTFFALNRNQTHFRIVVTNTDIVPYLQVADTGWIGSSEFSYTFPSQILENSTNYEIIVYVRDNAGKVSNSEANLVGNHNFETGTVTGWTATNGTISADTAHVPFDGGTYAMKVIPSTGVNVETTSYAVLAGHPYTAAFTMWTATTWNSVTVRLDWRDASDVHLSYSDATLGLSGNIWETHYLNVTAPVGAAYARLVFQMTGTPTGTNIVWLDNAILYHQSVYFSTTWIGPVDGDVVVTAPDAYKAIVAWTDALQDPDWIAWRVYRKYRVAASDELDVDDTANTWVSVYETTESLSSYEFRDYFAPLNRPVTYAVAQIVDRFGSQLESTLATSNTVTLLGDRFYFVPAVPIGSIASFEAAFVTADSFTSDVEQATLHVIGRGRQVQIGDDLGYKGSFTLKLRNPATARSDREFIELLAKSTNAAVYVRSPFGDVLYVIFEPVSFSRMAGVGSSDLGDLTVPYVEVFDDVPITRTA